MVAWVDSIEKALEVLSTSQPKTLGIGGLSKKLGVSGATRLAHVIEGNQSLVELVVNSNGIKAEGAAQLAIALRRNNKIKSLSLFDNQIGDEGARHVAQALRENTTLESIELGWNGIGALGGHHLLDALLTNHSLKSLRLQQNSFSLEFSKELRRVMGVNSSLRALDLRSSLGQHDAVFELISAIEGSAIVELDLSGNAIKDYEADKLASVLQQGNSLIEVLNVSECCIGQTGAISLAEAVANNHNLKFLDLRYNQASNQGAFKFAQALRFNTTLLHLDLGSNGIEKYGAESLAASLRENRTLRILGLGGNNVELDGAVALVRSLEQNISLERLNLEGNDISRDIIPTLLCSLKKNISMQMIDLLMNDLSYLEIEMVLSLLRKNVGWRKAAEMFVLVDSMRDGYFALSPNPPLIRRISFFESPFSAQPSLSPQGVLESDQRLRQTDNAIRFLKILQTPALHYDLRERICALVYEKQGFIPTFMTERGREELLGYIETLSLCGSEPRRTPGTGLSVGLNSGQWVRRIRGLGFEEFPKASLVPPMTFRLVTFLVASLISVVLVLGLSLLIVSVLPM